VAAGHEYWASFILFKAWKTEFTVIVTDFWTFRFCMRAGGHFSDFKLVHSTRNAKFELAIAEATPFNYSARGGGAKAQYEI
jgi:hypothetical protein